MSGLRRTLISYGFAAECVHCGTLYTEMVVDRDSLVQAAAELAGDREQHASQNGGYPRTDACTLPALSSRNAFAPKSRRAAHHMTPMISWIRPPIATIAEVSNARFLAHKS